YEARHREAQASPGDEPCQAVRSGADRGPNRILPLAGRHEVALRAIEAEGGEHDDDHRGHSGQKHARAIRPQVSAHERLEPMDIAERELEVAGVYRPLKLPSELGGGVLRPYEQYRVEALRPSRNADR